MLVAAFRGGQGVRGEAGVDAGPRASVDRRRGVAGARPARITGRSDAPSRTADHRQTAAPSRA